MREIVRMPFIKRIEHKYDYLCNHPEHNPPSHIVLPSGIHTYECPVCGHITMVNIPRISY